MIGRRFYGKCVLTDFTKKREFLICMDSDGCVMDTVRIKHSTVMCPELIRVFALDDYAEFITAAWDEINLHTITRASPGLRASGWCLTG